VHAGQSAGHADLGAADHQPEILAILAPEIVLDSEPTSIW
jgi:hypothetical protein